MVINVLICLRLLESKFNATGDLEGSGEGGGRWRGGGEERKKCVENCSIK